MKTSEAIMDRLQHVFETDMDAQVAILRGLSPIIDLPDIAEVYQEEFDYEQIPNVPGIVLYQQEPIVMSTGADLILFDLPILVAVWDIASGTGVSELHRRLDRYRRGIITLILEHYRVDPGYWEAVALTGYLSGPPVEAYGRYGRAKAVQFNFRVSESY